MKLTKDTTFFYIFLAFWNFKTLNNLYKFDVW